MLAKAFHFDIKHNTKIYECDICRKANPNNSIHSSFYSLLDHSYKYHEENGYSILDYLNIF